RGGQLRPRYAERDRPAEQGGMAERGYQLDALTRHILERGLARGQQALEHVGASGLPDESLRVGGARHIDAAAVEDRYHPALARLLPANDVGEILQERIARQH